MLKKKVNGAYSFVTSVKKKVSGTWSDVTAVQKKVSGAWSKVFPPNKWPGFARTTGNALVSTTELAVFSYNGLSSALESTGDIYIEAGATIEVNVSSATLYDSEGTGSWSVSICPRTNVANKVNIISANGSLATGTYTAVTTASRSDYYFRMNVYSYATMRINSIKINGIQVFPL